MKLISNRDDIIKREFYTIENNGDVFTLIWYVNPTTEAVIDVELRDASAKSVFDPATMVGSALLKEIELFVADIYLLNVNLKISISYHRL